MKLHDEDMTPDDFATELQRYDFGIWPEIVGWIGTIAIIAFLFATADGV